MPFVPQERRRALAIGGKPETVGDLCYLAYQEMVRQWNESPRWTTAHTIYKSLGTYWPIFSGVTMLNTPYDARDFQAAKELAWQIFLMRYVLPYEAEKEKEHGTI